MRPSLILIAAAFVFTGCEGSIGAPDGELALQTRNALYILPAGTDMAGMVNLQAARQSAIFEDHESPFSPENLNGESAARFKEFMSLTGFDPEEDVRRVYMTVSEVDGESNRPAFVVYADFDRARVDAYLDENAPAEITRTTYNDTPVYLVTEDDGTFGFGLINDEMAVAGEESELYAMIDRVANGVHGLSGDAEMMALIERAAHPDGAWFAVRKIDHHDDAHNDGPMAGMGLAANMVGSGVMSFGFGGDEVEMTAVGIPRDNASVGDVADILRGAISLMRTTSRQENPEMAAMLDGVRVRESSDAVYVQAILDPAFFEGMHMQRKH
ncbi:MAG: hypothetical protein IIC18_08380 [Bacteroidetes bacterium]|nr:hypothetical protein [Bacteroidota bacterium]